MNLILPQPSLTGGISPIGEENEQLWANYICGMYVGSEAFLAFPWNGRENQREKKEKNPKILLFQDLPPTPSSDIFDFYAITFQLTGAAFHENTRLSSLRPLDPHFKILSRARTSFADLITQ